MAVIWLLVALKDFVANVDANDKQARVSCSAMAQAFIQL